MRWKSTLRGTAFTLLTLAAISPAYAMCDAGTKIDGSTVHDARTKIEAAGYSHVIDLRKGCDNYWHGKATKHGEQLMVVLSPQGKVMLEGTSLAAELKASKA